MSIQANAEHDPQHQQPDLLQSQAVEQIHPEQLLSVSHVFDHQQKKGNQPQTLISEELDALTMNKGFLAKAQKKPVNDEKVEVLLAELLDRSKDVKKHERKGGYDNEADDSITKAKNYSNDRFKKSYGLVNFAETLYKSIYTDTVVPTFDSIIDGQQLALEKLHAEYTEAESKAKFRQSVVMASINILNTFIPIGATAVIGALEKALTKKYLGTLANSDLVTKIRLPQWGENIRSFGATAYRSAVVSTIGQVRGIWKAKTYPFWKINVKKINTKLKQLSRYAISHLILKMAQEAAEATPIDLSDADYRNDVEIAMRKAILAQVFPNLTQHNLIGTQNSGDGIISNFAEQQFLTETLFHSTKLDSNGEITQKEYKANSETSQYALNALQKMELNQYKDPNKIQGKKLDEDSVKGATLNQKDAYQTIEAVSQGPYDLAYQNMRSTLQYMGLDYNFTPDYHRGLRQSNTLGEKNWRLGIKIINMAQLRQALKEGFPRWAVGSGLEYPQREPFVLKGDDIYHIRRQALSPVKGGSGSVYLDFSQTNFQDIWVHTNRQDILAAKKGNIKDIRSFKLLFAASGPVFTINDLDHAGSETYGPKNISGKYQLQVIL